jgi:hypothetical protein
MFLSVSEKKKGGQVLVGARGFFFIPYTAHFAIKNAFIGKNVPASQVCIGIHNRCQARERI